MGYATGQFGKNHLGDLNEFLPTVHGFDEFFGYLYHTHLSPSYQALRNSTNGWPIEEAGMAQMDDDIGLVMKKLKDMGVPSLQRRATPTIVEELKKGKQVGDRNYKVHLDGYNQMDMITGKGPSNRHEIFYFGESALGAVRIDDYKYRFIDQPAAGWVTRPIRTCPT
jgi:arylsulfatase A-like enzyme